MIATGIEVTMALTAQQRLDSYKDVLRTFRATKAPAMMAQSVRVLRPMAGQSRVLSTLDRQVAQRVAELRKSGSPGEVAQAGTLESTHELVKFISALPEERATNRVLNSLDRANAVKFFGPVRNISMKDQEAAAQEVAAEAASLAPVRPEVLAGKIRIQQKILRSLDSRIKGERIAERRKALQAERKERLKEAAALVTAAKVKELNDAHRFKPFDIKSVKPTESRRRTAAIIKQIRVIDGQLKKLMMRMKTLKPGIQRTVTYNQYQKLNAEKSGLLKRLRLLRTGKDRVLLRRVRTESPRPQILLPPGVMFTPAPDMVTVIVRYLAQRIPRRPGESRRHFLLRLRMYVQRALARYAANSASEPEPAAAAEAAAVATITDDSEAIESEVDAGGVAEDPAAESMAEVVEELTPVLEQAAADLAPETVVNSAPEEFLTPADAEVAAAPVSPEFIEEAPPEVVEEILPEEIEQELEEAFETLDLQETPDFEEYAVAFDEETRPWFKNPVVLGGAALAALLILRR
jgi:hypothetical protein